MKRIFFPLLALLVIVVTIVMVSAKPDPKETVEEVRRDLTTSLEILATEETKNGLLVYSVGKVNNAKDNMYFVDYVKPSLTSYKWQSGGGHIDRGPNKGHDFILSLQLLEEPKLEKPIVLGLIQDNDIDTVEIKLNNQSATARFYGTNDLTRRLYVIQLEKEIEDVGQLQVILTKEDNTFYTFFIDDHEKLALLQEGQQVYLNKSDIR